MCGPLSADVKEYAFIERPTREFVSVPGRRRAVAGDIVVVKALQMRPLQILRPSRQERVRRGAEQPTAGQLRDAPAYGRCRRSSDNFWDEDDLRSLFQPN